MTADRVAQILGGEQVEGTDFEIAPFSLIDLGPLTQQLEASAGDSRNPNGVKITDFEIQPVILMGRNPEGHKGGGFNFRQVHVIFVNINTQRSLVSWWNNPNATLYPLTVDLSHTADAG